MKIMYSYLQFLQRFAEPAGCCYNEALKTFFGNRLVQGNQNNQTT